MKAPIYIESNLLLLKQRQQDYQNHKQNLKHVKSYMNIKSPYNGLTQMKSMYRELQRTKDIEQQNKKILNKMLDIHNKPLNKLQQSKSISSLNESFVRQKSKQISQQNTQILNRIMSIKLKNSQSVDKKVQMKQCQLRDDISRYSNKNKKRIGSFLKKLNIKSGNRSFSYDNSKTFSEQNKTLPTECVLPKLSFNPKQGFNKYQNNDSISILAAKLSQIRVSGIAQKQKLPSI